MHHFYELAYRCTYFSLNAINEVYERTVDELSETGSTPPVKNLQALNLQKMIHAVGLFSIFEAHLQRRLGAKNGYREAELILDFHNCYLAINALKHGDGASYRLLLGKISSLPFVVETPNVPVFEEGDVSGIDGLVKVDDAFIEYCLELIEKVSVCITTHRPDFML